jgi:hypothetical protein
MVDFDSVGRMAATPPVIIDPPVAGEFLWRSRRSLLFTPTEPWRLATVHGITLASGLTNLAGKPEFAAIKAGLAKSLPKTDAAPAGARRDRKRDQKAP